MQTNALTGTQSAKSKTHKATRIELHAPCCISDEVLFGSVCVGVCFGMFGVHCVGRWGGGRERDGSGSLRCDEDTKLAATKHGNCALGSQPWLEDGISIHIGWPMHNDEGRHQDKSVSQFREL